MSSWEGEINFINVLAQIGLAYPFAFLLVGRPRAVQVAAITLILGGYWYWFYQHPLPGPGFDYAGIGVPADWTHLTGMAAHWDLNISPAASFDRWLLNQFPRATPFEFRAGGGTTLNAVPSIATIAIGIIAGEWLRSGTDPRRHLRGLLSAGVACVVLGVAADPSILPFVHSMDWTICPMVKRIWTPSYVLYTAGWALLGLTLFYWWVDVRGRRCSAWPFTVVGLNSIVMYCLAALSAGWIAGRLQFFLGPEVFQGTFGPVWRSMLALLVIWLVAVWMYRRTIFVRV
jgi:predicted acyltransferase